MDFTSFQHALAGRSLLPDESPPVGGPWGSAADVIFCLLPLVFLVVVTVVKPLILPTSISLPLAAAILYFIRLAYLASPPNFVNACLVAGVFEALTPISIITGAILLFQAMDHTKCLPWMMGRIKELSGGHPVAEMYLIGWSFAYMVEGASGFGTPVALAAPMLASLGHDRLNTVVFLLISNTLATQFGAVGTPVWFGLAPTGLSEENLRLVGTKAAIIVGVCAYIVMPLATLYLVPSKVLLKNSLFILLSITTATLPSIGISFFSYEFPSLLAGVISILGTAVLIHFKVGLREIQPGDMPQPAETQMVQLENSDLAPGLSFASKIGSPQSTLNFPNTINPRKYSKLLKEDIGVQVDVTEVGHPSFLVQHGKSITAMRADLTAANGGETNGGESNGNNGLVDAEAQHDQAVIGDAGAIDEAQKAADVINSKGWIDYAFRTMPIWLTILVLIITRVPSFKVKGFLQSTTPAYFLNLQSFGLFGISESAVIQYTSILTESAVNWKYEFFYVPFFLPFFVVSSVTVLAFNRNFQKGVPLYTPYKEAVERVAGIVIATVGALILVQFIRYGGNASPAYIIGYNLSAWMREGFIAISAFLGALGSFFSGSTTVSNLTFGTIQQVAALGINLSVTTMLAIQVAGATCGNMICINNILSAKAVMGMVSMSEGEFIKRTALLCTLFCLLAQGLGCVFFFGLDNTAFFGDRLPLEGANADVGVA